MDEQIIAKENFKKNRIDEAIRRKKLMRIGWIAGFFVVAVLLIAGGVIYGRWRKQNLPGQEIMNLGQEHVAPGHEHAYNSNPPTSGWHYPRPAEWGVYKEELADETVIHNLEHGGIWIAYKPDISEEIQAKLEKFSEIYGRKIIVAPRAKNDTDIALAAWTRLDTFSASEYSDERVDKFIKAFRNKGPEFVP